ncbi:MAG: DUF917 domain-containing protein [Pseudomonadota bacterium]
MISELSPDDVVDILLGATVYGAGGGGELAEGLALVDRAVAAGKRFRMVSLDAVPDEALICTPYLLGAISDLPDAEDALINGATPPILAAFERLKEFVGAPIFGAVPCELGGSNTAVPFFVAAMADAVVVDADPAGRAVPEITHSAYALAGLPVGAIVTANAFGETAVLENVATDQRAEALVRALAQLCRNDIAAIDHTLPAKTLRPGLIPGTLSKARVIGQLLRQGQGEPCDLPSRIAAATGGAVLFHGEVTASETSVAAGFTVGSFEISGTDQYTGQSFTVTLKNENMVGVLDGKPVVTIPEIITVLDIETGQVVTNPNVKKSQKIAVLVLPAPDVFVTPRGLEAFGPTYIGINDAFRSALGVIPLT